MSHLHFSAALSVDQSPEDVFQAVNNVPGWWSKAFEGRSQSTDDVFEVRFGDVHYSQQKLTEVIPAQKVVWSVTDSHLSFLNDPGEWTGTQIRFDISRQGNKTELRLTHEGLLPGIECYDACSVAWGHYLRYSLYELITTGKGQPGFPPKGPRG